MRRGGWTLYGLLLAFAVALALAAGGQGQRDSPVPSVVNRGPLGAAALFTYLQEAGFDVRTRTEAWAGWPSELRTVVLAAPQARPVSAEDAAALARWVEHGGRAVLLLPGDPAAQEALARVFGAGPPDRLAAPAPDPRQAADPAGADAEVVAPVGPLRALPALRVAGQRILPAPGPQAVPVARIDAGVVGWYQPRGKGEVWLFAGPDLVENRRLELGGNLAFWHRLAEEGPLVFDEFHHRPVEGRGPPVALWALGLQLLACFGLFVAARAQRLGPPRPEPVAQHRSMAEYLSSFAWLTRRARIEPELARALYTGFRRLLQDRQGILTTLPDEEAARSLEARCGLRAERTVAALCALHHLAASRRVSPRAFARTAREVARLERVVEGRDAGPRS
jgi:hypothetical protein